MLIRRLAWEELGTTPVNSFVAMDVSSRNFSGYCAVAAKKATRAANVDGVIWVYILQHAQTRSERENRTIMSRPCLGILVRVRDAAAKSA